MKQTCFTNAQKKSGAEVACEMHFASFWPLPKAGMPSAFGLLGQFYDQGEGVKADADAALHWYRRAYRSGDYSVANNIGCILRDKKRPVQAVKWFHRAVQRGDADANLNIARLYLQSKRDPKMAALYLRRARDSKTATRGSKEEARLLLKELRRKTSAG